MGTGAETNTKRVISGMRPTGRLHIGHYFGALQNWVKLQNDPTYECFYFIADWHALTSDYADTSGIAENVIQIAIDFLAAGLDPKKSIIFQQSLVPEHAELHLLLSMVTPLGWLERVPTYKEALENIKDKDLHTYGFLGYPVLQTADIVIYSEEGKSLVVPVGEDQVSHVELSREIVRKFNFHFGMTLQKFASGDNDTLLKYTLVQLHEHRDDSGIPDVPFDPDYRRYAVTLIRDQLIGRGISNVLEMVPKSRYLFNVSVLQEPEAMLTQTPRIPGLDGRKMSKSYGNAITLSESDADIRAKTKVMVTDPARKRRSDPGNPDVCPVYDWHKLFSPPETLEWAAKGCRRAGIGCIECKAKMADHLIEWLEREGIRERRLYYENRTEEVEDIIREGSVKARIVAQQTMLRVRDAVFTQRRIRGRTIRKAQSNT